MLLQKMTCAQCFHAPLTRSLGDTNGAEPFITAREHLDLLQDTNSAAYSLARFNSFDSSVFSRELETGELEVDGQANNSQISSGRKSIYLSLKIDFLPCLPDEEVLLTLIWVSFS